MQQLIVKILSDRVAIEPTFSGLNRMAALVHLSKNGLPTNRFNFET